MRELQAAALTGNTSPVAGVTALGAVLLVAGMAVRGLTHLVATARSGRRGPDPLHDVGAS